MIKKERLEELIEQGATVCNAYKDWDNVWHCRFGNVAQEKNYLLFKENGSSLSVIMYDTNNLYETKEQAEWEWEFGDIERTERLELPTWEEFDKSEKIVRFIGKNGGKCKLEGYFDLDLQNGFIDVVENGSSQLSLSEYTKENYILACRKAKELFLGEK